MSVVVNIKNKQKITYKNLVDRATKEVLYLGIYNECFCLDKYKGSTDIRNQPFILFSQKLFGRGFIFLLDDLYNIELTLNYPASIIDIIIFYKFIINLCNDFKIKNILVDGEKYNVLDIPKLQKTSTEFNKTIIHTNLKVGLTIFGCIYPIVLDEDLILKLRSNNIDKANNYFAKVLDKLQKPMYYYAKPLIYKVNKKYIARYALTKNVPTIFPKTTELPFGYDQKLKDKIMAWNVVIIDDSENKFTLVSEIPYQVFGEIINIKKRTNFDQEHKLITIDDSLLKKIKKYNIKAATEKLIVWLQDFRELGHRPARIKYTNEFITEDNIHCYIFKYKKTLFSKWYLGICSDSGVFSNFQEYHKNTELKDALNIIELLKTYWQKQVNKK